jgi:hypothetical protein
VTEVARFGMAMGVADAPKAKPITIATVLRIIFVPDQRVSEVRERVMTLPVSSRENNDHPL